jgi:hypothetical protein
MNKKQTAAAINELLETPMTTNEIKKASAKSLTLVLEGLTPKPEPVLPEDDGHMSNAEVEAASPTPEAPPEGVTSPMLAGIGKQVEQTNGPDILRKSAIESPCQFVWQTCEDMRLGQTDGARRKDVLAACTAAGVAFYTARTQIQLWKKAKDAPVDPLAHNGTVSVALDAGGNPITE